MENQIKLRHNLDILEIKFKEAGIKYSLKHELDDKSENPVSVQFQINGGREKFELYLYVSEINLEEAISTNFEEYNFIHGYEAVWSKSQDKIECELYDSRTHNRIFLQRLYKLVNRTTETDDDRTEPQAINYSVHLPKIGEIELSIGFCSKEFAFLSRTRERAGSNMFSSRKITLKILNSGCSTHERAKELLEKFSDSLLFQLDLLYDFSLQLQVQRNTLKERIARRSRRTSSIDDSSIIEEVKNEYDHEPMAMYRYAKDLSQMQTFQYLAYYQSIEYYFPIYASIDAKQKIQNLIRNPKFSPHRDSDISSIITAVKSTGGLKGIGNEREQLKSTIAACTSNSEIIEFIRSDDSRFNFFAENTKSKKISIKKISVKSDLSDFIAELAERIYEIRCRIVHSKLNEGSMEALLPYSMEAKELDHDMDLIEFIARKTLIRACRHITY